MSDLEDFKSRVEILEAAVNLLEERIAHLMDFQQIEPYKIDLSEEDAQKLKDWVAGNTQIYSLPARFRDIANGE